MKSNLRFLHFDQDGLAEACYHLTTTAYAPDTMDVLASCTGETLQTWSEDGVPYFVLCFTTAAGRRVGWIKLNEKSMLDCGSTPLGQEPVVGRKSISGRLAIEMADDCLTGLVRWDPFFSRFRLFSSPHLGSASAWTLVEAGQMDAGALLIQGDPGIRGSRFYLLQGGSP